jgi:hypothetical protein
MLYVEIREFNRTLISNDAIFSAASERPPTRNPDIPPSTR